MAAFTTFAPAADMSKYIRVHGLTNRPDLNGHDGVIYGDPLETGRFPVKMLHTQEEVKIHPDNFYRRKQDESDQDWEERMYMRSLMDKHEQHRGQYALENAASAAAEDATPQPYYYHVLGITREAIASDIKKAFRKLSRKHHPDKGGDPKKFQILRRAYDILTHGKLRRVYDREGEDGVEFMKEQMKKAEIRRTKREQKQADAEAEKAKQEEAEAERARKKAARAEAEAERIRAQEERREREMAERAEAEAAKARMDAVRKSAEKAQAEKARMFFEQQEAARKEALRKEAEQSSHSGGSNAAEDASPEPYYYHVLEITREASASDIKKAFHKLAKKHNPDKGGDLKKFHVLKRAYDILSHEKLRRVYDLEGQGGVDSIEELMKKAEIRRIKKEQKQADAEAERAKQEEAETLAKAATAEAQIQKKKKKKKKQNESAHSGGASKHPEKPKKKAVPMALYKACEKGDLQAVQDALNADGVDVNETNTRGVTPLIIASEEGHTEVVKLLLQTGGIDVNQAETKYGCTPLIIASREGHIEVVKLLLQTEGIDVNQARNDGSTALIIASENGHTEIVNLLEKFREKC